jgi:dolichol-phosphate mannosyltransferase
MEHIKNASIKIWGARHKIFRYLFSGGTATAINFILLYVFTDLVGLYYIFSVILSFIIAVTVSFMLQKFWTFQNASKENMKKQAVVYVIVSFINVIINVAFVYALVEFAGLHYLVAQFVSSIFIATESFFIYQFFIFKKVEVLPSTHES